MKTLLAVFSLAWVALFAGCEPPPRAEARRAYDAPVRAEESAAAQAAADRVRERLVAEIHAADALEREREALAAQTVAIEENTAAWQRAGRGAAPPANAAPAGGHRRFSSHGAEEAFRAGKLPEYQADAEARADREAIRRSVERIERDVNRITRERR
jgi:hypothetical protein